MTDAVFLHVRKVLALSAALAFAFSVAGCNEPAAQGSSTPKGLAVVPVFGEAREDVSSHLGFAGLRAGVVSEERLFGDTLLGFRFVDELRPDSMGVLPLQDGEIGVSLSFEDGNYTQHGRHVVPAAVDGSQRIEIPVEAARIDLSVQGIGANEVVVIRYNAPNGGGNATRGADNYGKNWYFPPGEITISVAREGSSSRDSRTVTLKAGESADVALTVPR
jgi:hypothetical protein